MSEKRNRIKLPAIYQDHMMLQREKPLRFRGTVSEDVTAVTIVLRNMSGQTSPEADNGGAPGPNAKPEVSVTVRPENGCLVCNFPASPAGTDKELLLYVNGEPEAELVFTDVCFGDIWLACGQSNMEYFLRYDAHFNDMNLEAEDPQIRMFNVPRVAFEGQEDTKDLSDSGYWFTKNDAAWPSFSAPGYCFAQSVRKAEGIPVGVIGCNWGGTPACAWVDPSYLTGDLDIYQKEYDQEVSAWEPEALKEASLKANAHENSYQWSMLWRTMMYGLTWVEQQQWQKEMAGKPELPMGPWHHYRPCGLYDTMIKTIAPYSVKGILWYQGESDAVHAERYDQMMKALIACFRDTWEDQGLPFLYVQLAPFARWLDCTGDRYEEVREKQDQVSHEVEGAHMISIMDLGSHDDIHPKYKREVGQRLALLARGHVYGENVLCESPEFSGAACSGKKLELSFRFAEGGLTVGEQDADAFCVMADGKRIPVTKIEAEGEGLTLTLAEEPAGEVKTAFAYAPYCEVHIWNKAGLPVKPWKE